jgi:excisionase family DNA binding protein
MFIIKKDSEMKNQLPSMNGELLSAIENLIDKKFKNLLSIQKDIVDVSDASFILGVSKGTVHKMCHRKIIPYFKPTGSTKIYFQRADLIAYMTENRFMSKTEMEAKTQSFFQKKIGGGFV